MNLIDGLDGLASGIAVLASLFLVAISLSLGSGYPLLLAASLAGGTMAFLYWNISSRKIFLGDSGSMWLGLALGTLMLHLSQVSAVPADDAAGADGRADLGHRRRRSCAAAATAPRSSRRTTTTCTTAWCASASRRRAR